MLRTLSGLAMLAVLSACATPEPKEPPLEGLITIASSPCIGLCPVFAMEVNAGDRYVLEAGANTIKEGRSTGGLPFGSFRRALDLLDRYEFDAKQRSYEAGNFETCPDRVTGTPTLTISRATGTSRKVVDYDVGCLDFAEKDTLDQLVAGLYRTFRVSDLVAVGEPPKADDERVQ